MKKIHRIVAASGLVLAMGGSLIAPPVSGLTEQFYQLGGASVYAAPGANDSTAIGAIISVEPSSDPNLPTIPTKAKVGQTITLPKGTLADASDPTNFAVNPNVRPTITDGSGRVVAYDADITNGFKFVPTSADEYTVVYSYSENEGFDFSPPATNLYSTTSRTFIIKVEGQKVSIELPVNNPGDAEDNVFLPTNVLGGTGESVKDIVIPNPVVRDEDGNDMELLPNVEKDGYKLVISVDNDKNLSSDGVGDNALPYDNEKGNYYFKPYAGKNVIRYSVLFDGRVISVLSKTVEGTIEYKTKFDINFTVSGLATSASLKERVKLPLASAYNKVDSNSSINVHTLISVQHRVDANTLSEPLEILYDEDEKYYYFIPEEVGSYKITYKVEDFYGNKAELEPFTIENVRDTVAPKIFVVEDYSAALEADAETIADTINKTDAKWMVPTKIGLTGGPTQITFPAIYGEDTVVGLSELTFIRNITSTVSGFSTINLQELASGDTASEKAAKAVSISLGSSGTINRAGDYTVSYRIMDKNGYPADWTYTFSVVSSLDGSAATAPTVKYPVDTPSIIENETTYSFTKPTVADDNDTNLKIEYFITLNGSTDINDAIYFIKEDADNSAKLSFNSTDVTHLTSNEYINKTLYQIATTLGGNSLTIVTSATNDFGKVTAKGENILVKNISDLTRPLITVANGNDVGFEDVANNSYEQGALLKVNGVTFSDNDSMLSISVIVRDGEGRIVDGQKNLGPIVKTKPGANYIYEHPGISFTPNLAGKYTVTYTAVDSANNFSAITFQIKKLSDTEGPTIEGVSSTTVEVELGTKYPLGKISAFDNDVNGVPGEISDRIQVSCDTGILEGNLFVAEAIGTYTIKYTVKDDAQYETTKYSSIRVVDKRAPVVFLKGNEIPGNVENAVRVQSDENGETSIGEWVFFTDMSDASSYEMIAIPNYSAHDKNDLGYSVSGIGANSKVEVSGQGRTYTVKKVDGSAYIVNGEYNDEFIAMTKNNLVLDTSNPTQYWFTPVTRGSYSAVYSATDLNGNSARTISITMTVGDNMAPTISFLEGKDVKETVSIGDSISVNTLKDLLIKDNRDRWSDSEIEDTSDDIKMKVSTISVKDESGKDLTFVESGEEGDKIYTWTFDKAGTYTLSITSVDMSGNRTTISRTITVLVEGTTSAVSNEVVGTILTIVSILILAGVIIYFIKGGKAKGQPARITSSADDTKKTSAVKAKKTETEKDNKDSDEPEIG